MQSQQILRPIILSRVMGVLCCMGGWATIAAIAPAAVHAYVSRVDVVVNVQAGETYETFLRRAETIARAAIQRSFDRDILISEVSVIVVGEKNGGSVQVLSLQASRQQWRSRPDPRRWATYYPSARVLLGFGRSPAGNVTSSSSQSATPTVLQPAIVQSTIVQPIIVQPTVLPAPIAPTSTGPALPNSVTAPGSSLEPAPTAPTNSPVRSPSRPIPTLAPGTTSLPPQ